MMRSRYVLAQTLVKQTIVVHLQLDKMFIPLPRPRLSIETTRPCAGFIVNYENEFAPLYNNNKPESNVTIECIFSCKIKPKLMTSRARGQFNIIYYSNAIKINILTHSARSYLAQSLRCVVLIGAPNVKGKR